jgi:hypothetical protein
VVGQDHGGLQEHDPRGGAHHDLQGHRPRRCARHRAAGPEGNTDALRQTLQTRLDPKDLDGIISMHLLESDAKLSGPTKELPAAGGGASDWFVLVDGTSVAGVSSVLASRFTGNAAPAGAMQISSGIYELMWDLAKSDITIA